MVLFIPHWDKQNHPLIIPQPHAKISFLASRESLPFHRHNHHE
jgi:hypothetical protein